MVDIKINNDNLEVKYLIGNYKDLPEYPTPKDALYSIIQWIIADDKDGDTIFSDNFVCKLLGDEVDLDYTKVLLRRLVKKEWLEHIKDTNTKSIYKIIRNPFI